MNRTWLYSGLAAAAAILVVIAWPAGSPPGDGQPREGGAGPEAAAPAAASGAVGSTRPGSAEIDDLRRRLDEEIRARRELERRIDALEGELAGLGIDVDGIDGAAEDGVDSARDTAGGEVAGDDALQRAWFDAQALVAAGMNEARARELKLFFEQLELERLRLRDRAAREGWDSTRTRIEFEALDDREQSVRERLGEEEYAAYLYAAGRPNRVEITSVLASAPAGQAGIRAGDRILRYAGERIYSPRELRAATAAGEIGVPVEIEVERDGESLRFYLSRGPMGVRTSPLSIAP